MRTFVIAALVALAAAQDKDGADKLPIATLSTLEPEKIDSDPLPTAEGDIEADDADHMDHADDADHADHMDHDDHADHDESNHKEKLRVA